MSLNAYAPVPALLTSLQRAGWGDLAGREWQGVRTTLHALTAQLPHKSGQGWTTAEQVASAAGLSSRWVRTRLHLLEELGVIVWTRGGVVAGVPAPSYFRIVKSALIALIRAARPLKDAADAARRVATRARVAHLRYVKPRGTHIRRSAHAELSASPLPLQGGTQPSSLPEKTYTWSADLECAHGALPGKCPSCRRAATKEAA